MLPRLSPAALKEGMNGRGATRASTTRPSRRLPRGRRRWIPHAVRLRPASSGGRKEGWEGASDGWTDESWNPAAPWPCGFEAPLPTSSRGPPPPRWTAPPPPFHGTPFLSFSRPAGGPRELQTELGGQGPRSGGFRGFQGGSMVPVIAGSPPAPPAVSSPHHHLLLFIQRRWVPLESSSAENCLSSSRQGSLGAEIRRVQAGGRGGCLGPTHEATR